MANDKSKLPMKDFGIDLFSSYELYMEPTVDNIQRCCNKLSNEIHGDDTHFTDLTWNKIYKSYGGAKCSAFDQIVFMKDSNDGIIGWCSLFTLENVLLVENVTLSGDVLSNMIEVFMSLLIERIQYDLSLENLRICLFVDPHDGDFVKQLKSIRYNKDICFEVVDKPERFVRSCEAGDLGVTWTDLGRPPSSKYDLYSSKMLSELKGFDVSKVSVFKGKMKRPIVVRETSQEESSLKDSVKPRKRGRPKSKPDPFAHRPKKRANWKKGPKITDSGVAIPRTIANAIQEEAIDTRNLPRKSHSKSPNRPMPKSPLRFRSASRSTTPLRK